MKTNPKLFLTELIHKKFKNNKITRIKNKIVSTSSPDRCITTLLKALPLIRKEIPNAEIYWAYGFKSGITKGGMENHEDSNIQEWVNKTKKLISQTEGFYDMGRLSHPDVLKLMKSSDVFAYGTYFPEIDCISMTKAMMSGCIPIVSSCAALKEKIGYVKNILVEHPHSVNPRLTYDNIDYFFK